MTHDRLLQAKEEYDRRKPTSRPRLFQDEHEQVRKQIRISGHQDDKQGLCHCGYDQACPTLICDRCGRQRPHNAVCIIERDDAGNVMTFFYRHCKCGAKQWMYPCEVRVVKRITR